MSLDYTNIRDAVTQRIMSGSKTLGGVFELMQDKWLRDLKVMTTAKVLRIDRATRRVLVQPLNKQLYRDRSPGVRQQVVCTIWQFAGNGFTIDLPISVGDVGWVLAADRESESVKDSHEAQAPSTITSHLYDYGIFIPDYYRQTKDSSGVAQTPYNGEDGRLVISTFDGGQKISVGSGDIRIQSSDASGSTKVVIAGGKVSIESPVEVSVTATKTTINGDVSVNGNFDATVVKTTAGVSLGTHKHTQSGPSPVCPS